MDTESSRAVKVMLEEFEIPATSLEIRSDMYVTGESVKCEYTPSLFKEMEQALMKAMVETPKIVFGEFKPTFEFKDWPVDPPVLNFTINPSIGIITW